MIEPPLWKRLISLFFLVGTIVLLFYIMWICSRGYPFELSLRSSDRFEVLTTAADFSNRAIGRII